jgi:parallel beta-helix repeat protein
MFEKYKKAVLELFRKVFNRYGSSGQRLTMVAFMVLFAGLGVYLLGGSHASGPAISQEAENGVIAGGACSVSDATASGGSAVSFGGSLCPAGAPVVSSAMQICGSTLLHSSWSGSGVPSNLMTGGGISGNIASGQYAGLPTYGSAGTNFPNAHNLIIVAAGANGTMGGATTASNTIYWFAPGTHTWGTNSFDHWTVGNNGYFIGGYANGTDATIDGQMKNEYGFFANGDSNTWQYLDMKGFAATGSSAGVATASTARTDQTNLVEYSYFHDGAADGGGGSPEGIGIIGQGHFDHNCFKNLGQTGINFFGEGTNISYNEFDHDGIIDDNNGVDAGMKGWETTNAIIDHNYVHNSETGYGIWLDTTNNGYQITNNFLSWNLRRAIELEISEGGLVQGNTFAFNGFGQSGTTNNLENPALSLNVAGGTALAGSNNSPNLLVTGNTLWDNWEGISLYAQGDRNCRTPQPVATYCNINDKASFDTFTGGNTGGDCSDGGCVLNSNAANGATSLSTTFEYAIGDKIGFANGSYPYRVTSVSPQPSTGPPDSGGPFTVGITPALSGAQSAGAQIWGQGTCNLYLNGSSNPALPTPASLGFGTQSMSYFDGCQWRVKNVQITNNFEHFVPTEIQTATPTWPVTFNSWPVTFNGETIDARLCYSGANFLDLGSSNNTKKCGANAMMAGNDGGYTGSCTLPWLELSIMSNSSFTGPLANLDAGDCGGHPESPANNLWSGNTYDGSHIFFRAYQDTVSATGSTNPAYACGNAVAGFQPVCDVTVSQWASIWQQH